MHVCAYMSVDSLMLEKVEISGPPPPARLDHAMCTIYLPTTPTTTTGDHRSKKSPADQGYHIECTLLLLTLVPMHNEYVCSSWFFLGYIIYNENTFQSNNFL